MLNKTLLFLIFCSWNVVVCSQTQVAQYSETEIKNYRKNITNISLIVGASSLLALSLDEPVNKWVRQYQSDFGNSYADLFNGFGEKLLVVPAVGLSWGAGYIFKDDKLRSTSWNAIKAIATTAVATEVVKLSAGRARPFLGEGAYSFSPFDGHDDYKSCPSGHVALAFAVFTPYAESYSRWLYIVPASVAFARMYKNKHWFSDTVIGGGLGFLSGWIFSHHPQKNIKFTGNSLVVCF